MEFDIHSAMEQHPEMLLIAIFREQLFSHGSQHFRCAAVILIVQKEVYVPRRPMAGMKIVLCRTLSLYKAVADPVVFEYARQLGHDSVQPGIGPFHADGLNHQLPGILKGHRKLGAVTLLRGNPVRDQSHHRLLSGKSDQSLPVNGRIIRYGTGLIPKAGTQQVEKQVIFRDIHKKCFCV